jgi:hypothetical protein
MAGTTTADLRWEVDPKFKPEDLNADSTQLRKRRQNARRPARKLRGFSTLLDVRSILACLKPQTLHASFHRLRQSSIDAELFDVVSGFEALTKP